MANVQVTLTDKLIQYGEMAFNPDLMEDARVKGVENFMHLIQNTGTLALMPALTFLVQPGRTKPWLRPALLFHLSLLAARPRGVQDTIEFVLSVHPSSAGHNDPANPGKGAGMSHEALKAVARLICSPPTSMTPEVWFKSIAPQLLSLLQLDDGSEMDRAAAYIIGFGILGRKLYGAPGTVGWKIFAESLLQCVDPTLGGSDPELQVSEVIVGSSQPKVLWEAGRVTSALKGLTALVTLHPNPQLTERLLRPIVLPLWALMTWNDRNNEDTQFDAVILARRLLQILLQVSSGAQSKHGGSIQSSYLQNILDKLMFQGRVRSLHMPWIYQRTRIKIIEPSHDQTLTQIFSEAYLESVGRVARSFVLLIQDTPGMESEISQLFMDLCRNWLNTQTSTSTPIVTRLQPMAAPEETEAKFIQATVLENMIAIVPEKLVTDSSQVLGLVSQVLSTFHIGSGRDSEDVVAVALSLLNLVLESPHMQETDDVKLLLQSIKTPLGVLAQSDLDISSRARDLQQLIEFRSAFYAPEIRPILTDQQYEDRKSYALALSYLTGLESPPPVRAQGLEIISNLVKANSPILDIPALLVMFTSLLQDNDEYIYLRIIKAFNELAAQHPKSVLKDLVERYVDQNEDSELDQRLRLGEALAQTVQRSGTAFSGDTARFVCEGLLSIASRRGRRLKSEKRQQNQEKLKQSQNQEAEEAWGGEVPQFEEEIEQNEVLSQIVSGWESKRGTEDIRIRASALSILGSAIEENISGIGSSLVSTAVDLSIHVLTLEPEPEKGILRRSAILLFMSFIKALDKARTAGQKLAFGLVGQSLDDMERVLRYVEGSDNDGLVRKHAGDVVSDLQTWKIKSLLPILGEQSEVQQIAGLSISGIGTRGSTGKARPRIEEIE